MALIRKQGTGTEAADPDKPDWSKVISQLFPSYAVYDKLLHCVLLLCVITSAFPAADRMQIDLLGLGLRQATSKVRTLISAKVMLYRTRADLAGDCR